MRAFFLSVFVGALAAAWLPLLISISLFLSGFPYHLLLPGSELDEISLLGGLAGAISPLVVAISIVLPSALIMGCQQQLCWQSFRKKLWVPISVSGLLRGS